MSRFTHTAHQLRSERWDQVDSRRLLERIRQDRREGVCWTITPWQRSVSYAHRSYLVHSDDGSLYAVFFRKAHPV